MARRVVLALTLACAACAAAAPRSVRYDLEQIAADTRARDTSPGFTGLPQAEVAPAG